MTTPTVSKNEGEKENKDFETQVREFTAKHLGKVIIAVFFLCGFLWSSFQIPQLDNLRKANELLEKRVDKTETFVIIIEKYSARILDITKNEQERQVWKEMLQEVKEAKNKEKDKK